MTVQDTTPPVVTAPDNVTVEPTGADGAVVTYAAATATDAVTAQPVITYSQASGTTFGLGVTEVTATATDAAGNTGTAVSTVTVRSASPQQVGDSGGTYATILSADVAPLTFAVSKHATLSITPSFVNPIPSLPHSVSATVTLPNGLNWVNQPAPTVKTDGTRAWVEGSTEVTSATAGRYTVTIGDKTFKDIVTVYSVSIKSLDKTKLLATGTKSVEATLTPSGLTGTFTWTHDRAGAFSPASTSAKPSYTAPEALTPKELTDKLHVVFQASGCSGDNKASDDKDLNITAPRLFSTDTRLWHVQSASA